MPRPRLGADPQTKAAPPLSQPATSHLPIHTPTSEPVERIRELDKRLTVIDLAMSTDDLGVIADYVGLTVGTVKQYLDEAYQTWQMQYLDKTTQYKAKLMARMEALHNVSFPRATGYVDEAGVLVPPDRNFIKTELEIIRLQYQFIRDQEELAFKLAAKARESGSPEGFTPTFTTSHDLFSQALQALNDRNQAGVYADMTTDDLIYPLKREVIEATIEVEEATVSENTHKLVQRITQIEELIHERGEDNDD